MLEAVTHIISFFITVPMVASFIVYVISMIRLRNLWKAIHMMVDWTTLFYILAVMIMLLVLFERHFFGYILIFLLMALSVIIFNQWKKERDIQLKKAVKLLWRISFLLFFFLYGCLTVLGIIKYMLT